MTAQSELPRWLRVASRTLAALFGGYGLASLAAACAVTLPMARSDAVLIGMVVGLVVQVVWGDVGLNGLFDLVSSNRAPSQIIERIDLLRGPGALINGVPPGVVVIGPISLVTDLLLGAPPFRNLS